MLENKREVAEGFHLAENRGGDKEREADEVEEGKPYGAGSSVGIPAPFDQERLTKVIVETLNTDAMESREGNRGRTYKTTGAQTWRIPLKEGYLQMTVSANYFPWAGTRGLKVSEADIHTLEQAQELLTKLGAPNAAKQLGRTLKKVA